MENDQGAEIAKIKTHERENELNDDIGGLGLSYKQDYARKVTLQGAGLEEEHQALGQLGQLAEQVDQDQRPHAGQGVVDLLLVGECEELLHLQPVVLVAHADHDHADDQLEHINSQEPDLYLDRSRATSAVDDVGDARVHEDGQEAQHDQHVGHLQHLGQCGAGLVGLGDDAVGDVEDQGAEVPVVEEGLQVVEPGQVVGDAKAQITY